MKPPPFAKQTNKTTTTKTKQFSARLDYSL